MSAAFLIYAAKVIGEKYDKAWQQGKRDFTLLTEVCRFIAWDWIFLIYSCVFLVSLVYDFVVIGVGAADDGTCMGMIGNITSGVVHLVLRGLLCCFFCCIVCQMQCSENPFVKPILVFLSCGLVKNTPAERQRKREQHEQADRMNNDGPKADHS